MSTLLVPTDFSSTAQNAITYAIGFAREYQLSITLFHAVSPSSIGLVNSVHAVDNGEHLLNEANKTLSATAQALKEANQDITINTQSQIGYLMDSLDEVCSQLNPIAIVMGVTGSGGAMYKFIGSNAINVMNHNKFPTIIVPKKAEFKAIQKLAFACDLKAVASSTPVVSIKAFAKLFQAEVSILNVDYHNRHFTPQTPEEMKHLDTMLEDTRHRFHFIEEDADIDHAIDDFIMKHDIEMLIMLPKKHNVLDQLLHKSHSKEMAYHTHVPILALHAD